MLDFAQAHGLWVIATLPWGWGRDFLYHHRIFDEALHQQTRFLQELGDHPALAMLLVANEIPPDMVRWMRPVAVRESLEQMIREAREVAPDVLYGYANFPTTEYLEPANADVSCFNVFLEDEQAFANYLGHLHVVAGDRPLVLGEIGLDTQRNSEQDQADLLVAQVVAAFRTGVAGVTLYAWSDAWQNNGREMTEWSFGLTRRDGSPKPALERLGRTLPVFAEVRPQADQGVRISVVVCCYNGAERIGACLQSLQKLNYRNYEIIVADDGSEDDTADIAEAFNGVQVLRLKHRGLSAARNAGAHAATGEWIAYTDDDCVVDEDWLGWAATAFGEADVAAIGGPNLVPQAQGWQEAAVESAVGGPSHVLMSDRRAEHIPGCHFIVRRDVLLEIGGFDRRFVAAGDDVDLCWRLMEAGHEIAFVPQSYVIHRRRLTLWKYIKQQRGYGRAEAMLLRKSPERFARNGQIEWSGVIYTGSTARVSDGAIIYHGEMGVAPYQSLAMKVMPLRPLSAQYDRWWVRCCLQVAEWVAQEWRRWHRTGALEWRRWRRIRRRRTTGWKTYADQMDAGQVKVEVVEWSVTSQDGLARWDFLEILRENDWYAHGDEMRWDVAKQGTKLLLATEQTEGSKTTTLFRAQVVKGQGERVRSELERVLGVTFE